MKNSLTDWLLQAFAPTCIQADNHILFFILTSFMLFACNEIEKPTENEIPNEIPIGAQEVSLVVDRSLNFSNFMAHSILDSIPLNGPRKNIFIPKDYQSLLMFTDKQTGEIMAISQTNIGGSEVNINIESITDATVMLLPMYSSLPDEQKADFFQKVKNEKAYKDLELIVVDILNKRESIFSDRADFIEKLLEVNLYIIQNYFPNSAIPILNN